MAFLQFSKSTTLPLFYNINYNVGRKSTNSPEDVSLVAFLFKKWMEKDGTPSLKTLASKVVNFHYDENLQALIDGVQEGFSGNPGAKVDGHISKAQADATYGGEKTGFLICVANYNVAKKYPLEWPRIDRLAGSPLLVRALVKRVMLPD